MKFKFHLQAVKDYRETQEEIAQAAYAAAIAELNSEEAVLNGMVTAIQKAMDFSHNVKVVGGQAKASLVSAEEFIKGQEIRIERQKQVIAEVQKVVDEKYNDLVEAARERRIMEKLEERKLAEFKAMVRKKELKESNELVVNTWGRK
jgi:flagellar FliJ protein